MKIVEFRIFVPLAFTDCEKASRYVVLKSIEEENKNGFKIPIIDTKTIPNAEFPEPDPSYTRDGHFSHRIYHVKAKLPKSLRWALPEKYDELHEFNSNTFPVFDSQMSMPGLGNAMLLSVVSKHYRVTKNFKCPENPTNLSAKELKKRQIVYIDIVNGKLAGKSTSKVSGDDDDSVFVPGYKDMNFDLRGFKYEPSGVSELKQMKPSDDKSFPTWIKEYEGPLTLIVKTLKFKFKQFGLQNAAESYIANIFYPRMFFESHRRMVKLLPEWFPMDRQEIENFEKDLV